MNIDYLVEFVYLADSLSFRETADHFYVSRSVISRHIAALEETLGARLLVRDTRKVELTEVGQVFYREAQTLVRDWEIAISRVNAVQGEGNKLVRVGYLKNGARPFLVRFIDRLAHKHPDVQPSLLCMEYGELNRALDEHAIDVAIAINADSIVNANYRSTMIYRDSFYAVCSKSHALASKQSINVEDLRGQKILIPESYISSGLVDLLQELIDNEARSSAQTYYRDLDLLYLKIQTEAYIAFFSSLNAALFKEHLAIVPISGIDTSFTISAFYHNEFSGAAFDACQESFEWCRVALRENEAALGDEFSAGFQF